MRRVLRRPSKSKRDSGFGNFIATRFMEIKLFRNKASKASRDRGEPQKPNDDAQGTILITDRDDFVVDAVRSALSRANKSPVESYAVVLRLLRAPPKPLTRGVIKGLEDMARSYARESLRDRELGTWAFEMPVQHDDYARFTSYHRRCRIRLVEFMATGELIKATGSDWVWYNTRCGVCPIVSRSTVVSSAALGGERDPAVWWVMYWERVVAAVGETPYEGPFGDESTWGDTLRALAKECPACHEAAAREFPVFRRKLVNLVTRIIDGVDLEIQL